MREVTEIEVKKRLAFDNPWWEGGAIDQALRNWPERDYLHTFVSLVTSTSINRAILLLGPRRVGKTVMILQTIQRLINAGTKPSEILYVSVDTPVYFGWRLDQLLRLFQELHDHERTKRVYVFFDEIQYHKGWEIHLKSLVDSFPAIRFAASGSAAAALRLKSRESGAGRFTDLLLPPLTFAEFTDFRGSTERANPVPSDLTKLDIDLLNAEFLAYLNFGGFPEAVFSELIQQHLHQHVGADIIDKVLLKDLPNLYGIQDTQDLNRLFTTLAYNTGSEISISDLASRAGIAKNTLSRYIEYLEAAFLIRRVHRIDENARRFKRASHFKVYLTNPCVRSALFGPIDADDDAMGRMAETAFVSQLSFAENIHYARWKNGEVDFVILNSATQTPERAIEIKWSDRVRTQRGENRSLRFFMRRHESLKDAVICTRSYLDEDLIAGRRIYYRPVAFWCHIAGRHANYSEAMAAEIRAHAPK
ncbi:MAG TPA: ATP-binding protein [Alphaproteobacteria bacterium]|nr:ATP-binding protein [Alphaproteobacteria bacterium]